MESKNVFEARLSDIGKQIIPFTPPVMRGAVKSGVIADIEQWLDMCLMAHEGDWPSCVSEDMEITDLYEIVKVDPSTPGITGLKKPNGPWRSPK